MRLARFAAGASALLFIALSATAAAAVRPVDITGFAFSPQSVTITVGDTVTWTNRESFQHSARVPGVGTTAVLSQGQSASLVFNAVGTFNYDCGIHGSAMPGTVIVRAAATPPPPPPSTPVPTVRTSAPTTPVPTPQPTVAPTATPTASPSPSPSPTVVATTPVPTQSPTVAVVAPSTAPPAPAVSTDEGAGTTALLVAAAAAAGLAVVAYALVRRGR